MLSGLWLWLWLWLWLLLMLVVTSSTGAGDNMTRKKKIRDKEDLTRDHWWTLANIGRERSNDLRTSLTHLITTPRLLPLTRRQRKLIVRNPGSLLAVAEGARMAVEECQHQFRAHRWNCPTLGENSAGASSVFGKIVHRGFRETAFIYAITSAAVSHSVSRACSEGRLYTCTCYEPPTPKSTGSGKADWQWSGCGDNFRFGNRFSRRFVDVVERGRDFRFLMNLHNNRVGRVHVRKGMERECKCHGMSGSCTIRTCWMRLSPFRRLAHRLKDRFLKASRVLPGNDGNIRGHKRRHLVFQTVQSQRKPPGRKDLVYFETSPRFCDDDVSIGFHGNRGRECNASSRDVGGCDHLCCGQGFKTETHLVKERCRCTFHWCCHVTCEVCTVRKSRYMCT